MDEQHPELTIEEVLEKALLQEQKVIEFYRASLHEVGYDAQQLILSLIRSHEEHCLLLQKFREEVGLNRDMTIAMVD